MTEVNMRVPTALVLSIVLISVPGVTAQESTSGEAALQWYDSVFILCCGFDFNDKPFCTNVRRQECWAYRGGQVYNCKECEGAEGL